MATRSAKSLPLAARSRFVGLAERFRFSPSTFGPEHDLPPTDRSAGSVIVAATPRTGSELLCDALRQTHALGFPAEYFTPGALYVGWRRFGHPRPTTRDERRRRLRRVLARPGWYGIRDTQVGTLRGYLDEVVRRRRTANGVFSIKLMWQDYERVRGVEGFRVEWLPQPVRWVHLEREDLLAAAVSLVRAQQTRTWHRPASQVDFDHPGGVYRADAIHQQLLRLADGTAQWRWFFERNGIVPVHVTYEDLVSEYTSTVDRVLCGLGVGGDATIVPRLAPTGDATSVEWHDRFLAERPHVVAEAQRLVTGGEV